MVGLKTFMMRDEGAVSVEWVAATAALIVVSSFMGYYLFFGINEIREENNTDFNRVQTGESAGGGGIE